MDFEDFCELMTIGEKYYGLSLVTRKGPWKKTVVDNLNKVVEKEAKEKNIAEIIARNNFANKMAEATGHADSKSYKEMFQGTNSCSADAILAMEDVLGISRDDILGPIDREGIKNNYRFERLYTYMRRSEEYEVNINRVLGTFVYILSQTDEREIDVVCEMIQNCIKKNYYKIKQEDFS